MPEQIILNREDFVAEIIINRPEKMNAMTPDMIETLGKICREVDRDDAVRVVLLRGAGERAFSAGSDLHALVAYPSIWDYRNRVDYATLVRDIRKPVVVALKGWVLGGGLEMALGADIRVAGKSAKFGTPEVIRGWVPGAGATQLLPRLIGYGRAMRLMLTGETISSQQAEAFGIVEYLVEDTAVDDTAMAVCRTLAKHSPIAVQAVKAATRAALSMPLEAGLKYENEMTTLCFAAGNYQEGVQAFDGRSAAAKD